MFFRKCRVCAEKDSRFNDQLAHLKAMLDEKDARITDLRREMEYLRKLAFPTRQANTALPVLHLERDKILNGDNDVTEYTSKDGVLIDAETPDFPDPDIEANALLTGNF